MRTRTFTIKGNGAAVIVIGESGPELYEYSDLTKAEVARAFRLIVENLDLCLERWREYHG